MNWRFKGNELKYLKEVLGSGFSAKNCTAMSERLERAFAEKHGVKYAIAANSGTSTLHMALKAFNIQPGDEVIIPALTVAMCGFAVVHCGATPVYADVLKDTFLIDPTDIERKITAKTKAIMPVHIYGLMCDMGRIKEIADKYHLYVVEDCAQCFLAKNAKGQLSGTVGDVGSWSFESSKHMACGEGGIVTTNNDELAKRMRKFGGLGFTNLTATSGKVRISKDKFQDPDWKRHDTIGLNYRLSEPCAAIALAQLERLPDFVSRRQKMAESYTQIINNTGTKLLVPQKTPSSYEHTYYTYGALFMGESYGISWKDFRKKYVENGGDGIYSAWQTVNNEPAFENIGYGVVPIAEYLQRNLMQFTTNQKNEQERRKQADILYHTLSYFRK